MLLSNYFGKYGPRAKMWPRANGASGQTNPACRPGRAGARPGRELGDSGVERGRAGTAGLLFSGGRDPDLEALFERDELGQRLGERHALLVHLLEHREQRLVVVLLLDQVAEPGTLQSVHQIRAGGVLVGLDEGHLRGEVRRVAVDRVGRPA